MDLSPCEKTQMLADKWRHERNFWMAALAVTLWVVLNRFYSLNKKNLDLCVPSHRSCHVALLCSQELCR